MSSACHFRRDESGVWTPTHFRHDTTISHTVWFLKEGENFASLKMKPKSFWIWFGPQDILLRNRRVGKFQQIEHSHTSMAVWNGSSDIAHIIWKEKNTLYSRVQHVYLCNYKPEMFLYWRLVVALPTKDSIRVQHVNSHDLSTDTEL